MNYRHVYMLIIEHAKKELNLGLRPSNSHKRKNFPGQYFEFHHILPKSLFPLWSKRKSNIVPLTAREHFFCHQLLTKIYPTKSMFYALYAFTNSPNTDFSNYKITSRIYEKLRLEFSHIKSEETKKWWKTLSNEEIEERTRKSKERLNQGRERYLMNRTEEEKQRVSKKLSISRKKYFNEHYEEYLASRQEYCKSKSFIMSRQKWQETMKSKSEEELKEINAKKIVNKGKHWYNNGEKELYADECPIGFQKGRLKMSEEKRKHYTEVRKSLNIGEKVAKALSMKSDEEKLEIYNKWKESYNKRDKELEQKRRRETISKRTKEQNIEIRRKQLKTMKENGYEFKTKRDEKDEASIKK